MADDRDIKPTTVTPTEGKKAAAAQSLTGEAKSASPQQATRQRIEQVLRHFVPNPAQQTSNNKDVSETNEFYDTGANLKASGSLDDEEGLRRKARTSMDVNAELTALAILRKVDIKLGRVPNAAQLHKGMDHGVDPKLKSNIEDNSLGQG